MPFILRDASGTVTKITTQPVHGGEMVSYSHPEVQAFLKSGDQDPKAVDEALTELRKTDADMTRAIEDVITALLRKSVLKMTDLPKPLQERIALRVNLRAMIQETFDQAIAIRERKAARAQEAEEADSIF